MAEVPQRFAILHARNVSSGCMYSVADAALLRNRRMTDSTPGHVARAVRPLGVGLGEDALRRVTVTGAVVKSWFGLDVGTGASVKAVPTVGWRLF